LFREGGLYTFGLFLLIPLYLSLLDEAEYGAFGVVRHLVSFLVPLAVVGQTHSLLKLGVDAEGDKEVRGALLGSVVAWVFFAGIAVSAIAAVAWPLLGDRIEGVPLWPLGVAGLTMVTGQAMFNIVLCWLQQDRRPEIHTALSLARWGVLLLGVLLFVVVLQWGAAGILAAMAVAFTVGAAMGLRVILKDERPVIRRVALLGSLAYGLPLLPHTLSTILFQATDQVLLAASDSAGLGVAGLYLLATQIASTVFMFSMGMQKAWIPFFLREDRDREDAGWDRVRQLSFFAVSMVGVAAVVVGMAAPELIWLAGSFSDHDWSEAGTVVPILVLGAFVRSYYLVSLAVVMANQSVARWIAVATVPTAALNLVLNLRWIPEHGMQGAAWATATSWVIAALATGLLARRARTVPFKYGHALVLVGMVAAALLLGAGQTLPVRLGVIVGFCAALLVLDGRDIRSAFTSLRRRGRS
jgi:O-antigen/teichoic acid export membrane protein